MFYTGFADEASADIDRQIAATKKLGWKFIETRNINGKSLATLTDAEFETVKGKLHDAGIAFNCFGSGVANWGKSPRSDKDFADSKKELLDAVPRMHALGIRMIRGMSFLTPTDEAPDSPELEKIIFAKVRELVKICADNGIVYAHENCMNYGGLSHLHTLKLIEAVNDPKNFTLIFDTGNPTFNYRHIGSAPYPLQSAWEFYRNVREFISYVHIKDSTAIPDPSGKRPTPVFTYAGEGCGDVRAIVCDLLRNGYDGGFSMEPHVAVVFHDADPKKQEAGMAKLRFDTYVRYGRLFEKLVWDVKKFI